MLVLERRTTVTASRRIGHGLRGVDQASLSCVTAPKTRVTFEANVLNNLDNRKANEQATLAPMAASYDRLTFVSTESPTRFTKLSGSLPETGDPTS